MPILFAGGEDTSIDPAGTITGFSDSTYYRSAYARASMYLTNGSSTADPPANRARTPTFAAGSILWVSGRYSSFAFSTSANGQQVILIRSPDDVSRVLLRQTGTLGTFKVSTRNSAGTIVDVGTSTNVTLTRRSKLDWYVDYTGSPGGTALYHDKTLILNYVGDLRTDAATQLYRTEYMAFHDSGEFSHWSELIVADEDTRDMALWTLSPQAAGNTQGFTPNTLGNINEAVLSDGTLIGTGSNDVLSQWTTPVTPPTGTWSVKAIVQEARVRVDTTPTGPQHFDWSSRTSSANYDAGASNAPTNSFSNFSGKVWSTNPSTNKPWVIGNIASGFNLGIKSLA